MPDIERPTARAAGSLEAAMVARRYYLDDKQKSEIAEEMGISRFKVARLLEEARSSGIVRIQIDVPTELDLSLGEAVARRYGIRRAIAARSLDDDPDTVATIVGTAAAQYLAGALGASDVLGISWGRALTQAVEAVSSRTMTDVVQLVGGVRARGSEVSGMELVRRLAEKTGGRAYPLYAPLLVKDAEMARGLRSDPSLADTIARFPELTVAAVGIGAWGATGSTLIPELSPTERTELDSRGAVADVCALVLDSDGADVGSALLGRSVGITMEELRRVPDVIGIAGGLDKVAAIAAVLKSGAVNTLVTDSRTAQRLLQI